MREIKFRAWDVFNAEMFPEKANDDLLVKFFRDVNQRRNGGNAVHVMQYTGLKDKNGVEIWESDIVSGPNIGSTIERSEVVEFNEGGFYPFCIAGWEVTADWRQCEVIGNIYENKELLE